MKALLPSGSIEYVDSGPRSGLPVVFIHGFPFSHEMWTPQVGPVSQAYRAIAYDIRGHGMSDVGDGQYTIEAHVDDLFGLLDLLSITECVVVGLSMGGYIALRALERTPARFRGAVLCDTKSDPDTNEGKIKRFETMKSVKRGGSAEFAESFAKAVFWEKSLESKPDMVASIKRIIARTPPLSIAGTLLALASRTDTTPSLNLISVPTLIMVGEHDAVTPPAASRAMHEKIPGSQLQVIPGAGHMSNLENSEAFNEHLLAFLRRFA
jgi:pimeloyl-ACP methyl ester carboxylesterase